MSQTKVITGKVRFSYVQVFEPKAMNESSTPKYSISLIIPKGDKKTLDKIKAAIESAIEEGKTSKWGGKVPKNLKTPLRDGDDEREDDEALITFCRTRSRIRCRRKNSFYNRSHRTRTL